MGLFSRVFGGQKNERSPQPAFEAIRRILEDEEYQLEMMHPAIKAIIERRPAYDRDPNGTGEFGFAETNPIPVNGPIGELAYLSSLETEGGERILFPRLGAIDTVDVFEVVTFSGSQWFILFLDFYHPRRSRVAPAGFRFRSVTSQFSGFNKACDSFPYDFVAMKEAERESGLSLAYIPIDKVEPQIRARAYERPLAHKVKLDVIRSRLTSSQS